MILLSADTYITVVSIFSSGDTNLSSSEADEEGPDDPGLESDDRDLSDDFDS